MPQGKEKPKSAVQSTKMQKRYTKQTTQILPYRPAPLFCSHVHRGRMLTLTSVATTIPSVALGTLDPSPRIISLLPASSSTR